MIGGSPHQSSESDDDDTSYSSYDSEEYHRASYEERRNKRRDKYNSRNDRDRERDRKERRNRDSEREVCLRFSEFGHCPDVNRMTFNLIHKSLIDYFFTSNRITVLVFMKFDSPRKWNCVNFGLWNVVLRRKSVHICMEIFHVNITT